MLFLCDLVNRKVYYLPIQDFFIKNETKYETLYEKNDGKMNLHIPTLNEVTSDDSSLIQLAKSTYTFRYDRVYKIDNG